MTCPWRKEVMSKARRRGREKLRAIIEACRKVEAGKLDPFSVPVEELIEAVRELFPLWEEPEDLALDAEALEAISGVIKAQSEWVRERSTRLYRDPFLIEEKLAGAEPGELAGLFLKCWHPIVELEQMTPLSLELALKYWLELPGREVEARAPEAPVGLGEAAEGEVEFERLHEEIEALWSELREKARGGWVRYWDFVAADTYSETVRRAYLTSFLITYGYASLDVDPLTEELVLKPRRKPRMRPREKMTSLVIPLSREDWMSHVG